MTAIWEKALKPTLLDFAGEVLVNSAGGNVKQRHWGNLAPASASEVVDLDLKAMFYCTLAALPAMRARSDGNHVEVTVRDHGVGFDATTGARGLPEVISVRLHDL